MARQSKTKYAVLGVLSHQPGSGYDIKNILERDIAEFWSESYGQIYPTTKSLVEDGYATCTAERTKGKPDRYVFSITEKGMEELRRWLDLPTEPHRLRLEVLLKLMCGAHMPTEANIRLIEGFREEWIHNLKTYEESLDAATARFEDTPHLAYMRMLVSCGRHIGNAYVAWCDEAIAALKAMEHDLPSDQTE